jgi:hypothetical protein
MPNETATRGSFHLTGVKQVPIDQASPAVLKAVKYVCCEFLQVSHYKQLHQVLSTELHNVSSLSAAVKLLEQYGVFISPDEVAKMSQMDESQQVNKLVSMMPQQTNEQFQQFFLELQILVSTASRIRKALEEGNPDEVEQALTEASTSGVGPHIHQMAIVQAGMEVKAFKAQYENWMKESDHRMAKLIRGQDDAMHAQRKLRTAQETLLAHQAGQNDKVKKVLMNFLGGNVGAILASFFKEWVNVLKVIRMESEVRAEFQDRLENVQKKLLEFKASQSAGLRNMMNKKGAAYEEALLQEIFSTWSQDVQSEKMERQRVAEHADLEKRLADMKKAQNANSKKVLARMSAGTDAGLTHTAFQAWFEYCQELKKLKAQDDAEREAQEKMKKMMEDKKDGTKKVMMAMTAGQDSAVIKMAFDAWKEVWDDAKREAAIADALAAQGAKMGQFNSRNKMNSMNACERAEYCANLMIYMKMFAAWKLDTKVEIAHRFHSGKIDGKRQQLIGVQHMFKKFAAQLESGLKETDDSHRSDGKKGLLPGISQGKIQSSQ